MPQLDQVIFFDVILITIFFFLIVYFFFLHIVLSGVYSSIRLRSLKIIKTYVFNSQILYYIKLLKIFNNYFNKLNNNFLKYISKNFISFIHIFKSVVILKVYFYYLTLIQKIFIQNFYTEFLPFILISVNFKPFFLLNSSLYSRYLNF